MSETLEHVDIAIVGHGGTGTLLYCHLAGVAIDRRYDQPATNGGNCFAFDRASRKLLCEGWQSIDAGQEKPREPAPVINLPAIRVLVTAAGERSVGSFLELFAANICNPRDQGRTALIIIARHGVRRAEASGRGHTGERREG